MVFTGKFLAKLQSYQLQLSSRKFVLCIQKAKICFCCLCNLLNEVKGRRIMLGGGNVFIVFYSLSSFVNKAYLKNNFPTDLSYVYFFYRKKSNVLGFYYVFNCYQCRIAFIIVI